MKPQRKPKLPFDLNLLLSKANCGSTSTEYRANDRMFVQGDPANTIFYIERGKVKLTVVSEHGKEAVVAILGAGDFFGEGCLAGQPYRMSTATAESECSVIKLEKAVVVRLLGEEPSFRELLLAHLLSRNNKVEEDLVHQLFNSSENRLATSASAAGKLREGRQQTGACDSEDQPGNIGGNHRHHSL
jgi:CRP/FNR family cyclic AMP-dependent transcriptional regulator